MVFLMLDARGQMGQLQLQGRTSPPSSYIVGHCFWLTIAIRNTDIANCFDAFAGLLLFFELEVPFALVNLFHALSDSF